MNKKSKLKPLILPLGIIYKNKINLNLEILKEKVFILLLLICTQILVLKNQNAPLQEAEQLSMMRQELVIIGMTTSCLKTKP